LQVHDEPLHMKKPTCLLMVRENIWNERTWSRNTSNLLKEEQRQHFTPDNQNDECCNALLGFLLFRFFHRRPTSLHLSSTKPLVMKHGACTW
jgi:hypothetical protein